MRLAPDRLSLSMFGEDSPLFDVARRASDRTGAPVVGGIAVHLHGYRRTTEDVDLFARDGRAVGAALRALGATWSRARREFLLDGVPIHLVTEEQTGSVPSRVSRIKGIRVVSLADLIRFKLHSGLRGVARAKDLADVVELIRAVPLDKRFASRLPRAQRDAFKRLVEAVRAEH